MYTSDEKKAIREEFWTRFRSYSAIRRRQKGKPAKWIMNNTGIRQLKLKFEFLENCASVGIEVETRNDDRRLDLFGKLEQLKTILYEALGSEMKWELEHQLGNGKSVSRVSLELPGVNIYDRETWESVFPFFYKNMMRIESFYEEYRDFLKFGK